MKIFIKIILIIAGLYFLCKGAIGFADYYFTLNLGFYDGSMEKMEFYRIVIQHIFIGLPLLIVGICLKKPKKEKTTNIKYVKRWIIILIQIIILISVCIFIAYSYDYDYIKNIIEKICIYIYNNMKIFYTIIGLVTLLSIIDIFRYSKLDEKINAVYLLFKKKNINFIDLFFQYFATIYTKASLIYYKDDLKIVSRRLFLNRIVLILKAILSYTAFIMIISLSISLYKVNSTEIINLSSKSSLVVLLMLFAPNIDIIIFIVAKLIGFLEITGYTVTINKYSDGSSSSSVKTHTNIFAIFFIALTLIIFYTGWFVFPIATKLTRIIETKKSVKFFKDNDVIDMEDYYNS